MTTGLPRTVKALGLVSFFTDVASEMIYPLVPIFLSGVLGANARFIGVVEGLAESVAALLKLVGGWWSDRLGRRKPLVVAGYALATVVRPFIGLAQAPWHVLAVRVTDRMGKGIRTAPRDALVVESADAKRRGRAFGFQRAADNAGAVVGPLIAFAVLWALGAGSLDSVDSDGAVRATSARAMRTVFLLSAIPGALALLTLWLGVREERGRATVADADPKTRRTEPFPRAFVIYLVLVAVFTLGNSSDAFLLLRARDLGIAIALAPVLWAVLHVVKAAGGTWGGALSDRFGRRPLIAAGWIVYALAYLGFAFASAEWHVWTLFIWYGVFFALTEGTERALIGDLAPPSRRGAAYGWYNMVIAMTALPASLLFGTLWDLFGARAAFLTGSGLALVAASGLAVLSTLTNASTVERTDAT